MLLRLSLLLVAAVEQSSPCFTAAVAAVVAAAIAAGLATIAYCGRLAVSPTFVTAVVGAASLAAVCNRFLVVGAAAAAAFAAVVAAVAAVAIAFFAAVFTADYAKLEPKKEIVPE